MFAKFDQVQKVFLGIFAVVIMAFGYCYFMGYSSSISWEIIAKANSENFIIHSFQKGPFLFDFKGMFYKLSEAFSAGPIERHFQVDALFLAIAFFGVSCLLAVTSTLSRTIFIGTSIVFVCFFFFLRLDDIGAFGFSNTSRYATAILFLAYLLPSYVFQAFWKIKISYRILLLNLITLIIWFSIGINSEILIDHLVTNSYFSFQILAIIFLFIVAEEIIFGILFMVSRVKGSQNSEKHFTIFGFTYLLLIGLYYTDMSGLLAIDARYFNPYLLLVISTTVSIWSLWYKKDYFIKVFELANARILFFALGIITFSFLGHMFFRGNDPGYQGFQYFIIYTHLAFGTFFFFYIILNFINPMAKGLQVYKVVYHAQNFPYISSKLAALAAITAFFVLSQKESYFLIRGGHYNYQGAEAATAGDGNLAVRYYEEAKVFGYDNHFSNYQLGHYHLKREELQVANHRFQRATFRYPSPQAYINQSRTAALMDEHTQAMVALKTGLVDFPENGYLSNNLGVLFMDIQNLDSARKYLKDQSSTGRWNEANNTNFLVVGNDLDSSSLAETYQTENLAVKSNVLASALLSNMEINLPLDSNTFNQSQLPLHKGAYLVNYSWANRNADESDFLLNAMNVPMNEELFRSAKQAIAIRSYLIGNINQAFLLMDDMIFQGSNYYKGLFHNQKGKMALEQHILPLALEAFEKALTYHNQEAQLNIIATLLEMGELETALQRVNEFAQFDDFFIGLRLDIEKLISGKDLSDEMAQSYAYYHYNDLELADLKSILRGSDTLYVQGLWTKIYKENLLENPSSSQELVSLFDPYMEGEEWQLQLSTLELIKGNELDSSTFLRLKEQAQMNAFNVPLIIEIANRISRENNLEAYELLVTASDANPNHPDLLKTYITESVKQKFFNYAESGLDRLEQLIPFKEYVIFRTDIMNQIQKQRKDSFGDFQ